MSNQYQVLALDVSGMPRRWISIQDSIVYYAKGQVAWEIGEHFVEYRGGFQKDNSQSKLSTAPIIAISGSEFAPKKRGEVVLSNFTLFGRDQNLCCYCGCTFEKHKLSRDHIVPTSKGGEDTWNNVVTACKSCNNKKDDRTPEQANMEMLYIPYVPNHNERLIIENRRILKDQMQFLLSGVPNHSRLL